MQQTRVQWCFFFAEYDQTPKITALRPCKNLVSHRIPSVVCMPSCREESEGGGGGGRAHLLVFKFIDTILTLTCRCTITVIFIQDISISWPRGLSVAGWVAYLSCLFSQVEILDKNSEFHVTNQGKFCLTLKNKSKRKKFNTTFRCRHDMMVLMNFMLR